MGCKWDKNEKRVNRNPGTVPYLQDGGLLKHTTPVSLLSFLSLLHTHTHLSFHLVKVVQIFPFPNLPASACNV